jgi:hypothetical protein
VAEAPRLLEPKDAAGVLQRTLDPTKSVTVADASVTSGLSLTDAEAGLHWLTSEFRGHLRVTEDGDLVHLFPTGFEKPWETRERWETLLRSVGSALLGAGRFVVRAWLLVVMVGYALLFLALILGLTFSRGSDSRDERPGFGLLGGLLRMILDAAYWTFHPFSPLYLHRDIDGFGRAPTRRYPGGSADAEEKVPFYEKVNRFVFGPPQPKVDPHAARAEILAEVRARRGRVTLADVMRVSGLSRAEADPLMARLMLEHDGTVLVSEGGGIVYRFEALRRSASATGSFEGNRMGSGTERRPAAWERPPELPPLTGNSGAANVGVALLNGFNLLASVWAIGNGLTFHNLALLFSPKQPHPTFDSSIPVALGVVPLVFSVVLFVLPMIRVLLRARETKRLAAARARLAVLREVVTHVERKAPLPDEAVRTAVRIATGNEPTSAEITRQIVELGGDVDVGPEGEVRYRFAELEADAEAVEEAREQAPEKEARLGAVVFASDR